MNLRTQILNSLETFSDFAWAADQRFREAEELLFAGRTVGAVYLFGLASEMWLKMACFRLLGATPATPVSSFLGPAKTWMAINGVGIQPESYHSLVFWAEYLVRRRFHAANPLPGQLIGRLRHHVMNRLFLDWRIEMRYRLVVLPESAATRVYNDTTWVRQNWNLLWR